MPEPQVNTEPRLEIETEKVANMLNVTQTVLGVTSKIDHLIISNQPNTPGYCTDGKTYTPVSGNPFAEIIAPWANDNLYPLAHEFGHILVNQENVTPSDRTLIELAWKEGVVDLAALYATQKLFDQKTVASHCINEIANNSQLRTALLKQDYTILNETLIEDGFFGNRTAVHIIGIGFAFSVFNQQTIHAWPILQKYPPTSEELLNPQSYLEKHQEEITNFQKPKIKPHTPLINPKFTPKDKRII